MTSIDRLIERSGPQSIDRPSNPTIDSSGSSTYKNISFQSTYLLRAWVPARGYVDSPVAAHTHSPAAANNDARGCGRKRERGAAGEESTRWLALACACGRACRLVMGLGRLISSVSSSWDDGMRDGLIHHTPIPSNHQRSLADRLGQRRSIDRLVRACHALDSTPHAISPIDRAQGATAGQRARATETRDD